MSGALETLAANRAAIGKGVWDHARALIGEQQVGVVVVIATEEGCVTTSNLNSDDWPALLAEVLKIKESTNG